MGDRTGISWTDATWNPIRGCSRVSQGCVHCYAETVAARFSKPGQAYEGLTDSNGRWNGKIITIPLHLRDPIRWRRPRKIFVNSMSDLFHENVPDPVIDDIFAVMALAPLHTFQILTKRPERMRSYLSKGVANRVADAVTRFQGWNPAAVDAARGMPLPNVWLGVSCEDQATADERIPLLLETPAAVRFISAEPLLGPIELYDYLHPSCECELSEPMSAVDQHDEACPAGAGNLDWVIVGGESGSGHRPMEPWWLSAIATECFAWNVPLFVKQDSGQKPGRQGRLSDVLWARKEFPLENPVTVDAR
jgi:protein gp37